MQRAVAQYWPMLLLASLGAGGCHPSQPVRLRVMTYNIHHGHGMDGKFDLSRTIQVINAAKPDLLALQEVDSKCERSRRVDEPQELAAQTGMQAASSQGSWSERLDHHVARPPRIRAGRVCRSIASRDVDVVLN